MNVIKPVSTLPWRLELRSVSKHYSNGTANGVLAVDGVDLQLARGEIHALIGENGAGKSTLMKMVYGLEQPSAGTILLDGKAVRFNAPATAIAAGIGLVPQHVQLIASFSVARNVVLGAEPARLGWLRQAEAVRATRDLSRRYGLEVDPLALVASLSLGEQQRVEVIKALYRGADLLMLDEPGAVLSQDEAVSLFCALRALADAGLTVLLITHKISDVLDVADRYTVLRAGRVVGSGVSAEASAAGLASLIVGQPVANLNMLNTPAPVDTAGGTQARAAARLRVQQLVLRTGTAECLDGVSFDVAPGEILGIAGVEGNGQHLLAKVLSGHAPDAGSVGVGGVDGIEVDYTGAGVRAALRCGVAVVPADRLHDGAAPDLSIADNAIASTYARAPLSLRGWLQPGAVDAAARRMIAAFRVKADGPQQAIGTLSGGNMQKIVLARSLESRPRVLVACQPTRGVDIGAATFLRDRLLALREAGAAIVLISADLDEVLLLSDRIAVMYRGRIAGHFRRGQAEAHTLAACMTGAHSPAHAGPRHSHDAALAKAAP